MKRDDPIEISSNKPATVGSSSSHLLASSKQKGRKKELILSEDDDGHFDFSTLAINSDRDVEKVSDVAPPLHLSTTFALDPEINDGSIYSRVRKLTCFVQTISHSNLIRQQDKE